MATGAPAAAACLDAMSPVLTFRACAQVGGAAVLSWRMVDEGDGAKTWLTLCTSCSQVSRDLGDAWGLDARLPLSIRFKVSSVNFTMAMASPANRPRQKKEVEVFQVEGRPLKVGAQLENVVEGFLRRWWKGKAGRGQAAALYADQERQRKALHGGASDALRRAFSVLDEQHNANPETTLVEEVDVVNVCDATGVDELVAMGALRQSHGDVPLALSLVRRSALGGALDVQRLALPPAEAHMEMARIRGVREEKTKLFAWAMAAREGGAAYEAAAAAAAAEAAAAREVAAAAAGEVAAASLADAQLVAVAEAQAEAAKQQQKTKGWFSGWGSKKKTEEKSSRKTQQKKRREDALPSSEDASSGETLPVVRIRSAGRQPTAAHISEVSAELSPGCGTLPAHECLLLDLLYYVRARVHNLHRYCVICDELHRGGDGMTQLMPNVCKDEFCVYRYQTFDFMADCAQIAEQARRVFAPRTRDAA